MSVPRTAARKIPGLAPGIFFFALAWTAAAGSSLDLAAELFGEGNWPAARTEALRAQQAEAAGPAAGRAQLLAAVSALRLGEAREEAKAALAALWQDPAEALETRCMAAYEFGRAEWAYGGQVAALTGLKFAYFHTRDTPLFWRSGCSLYFFLKADKQLRKLEAETWDSLQVCREVWPLEVWRECRPAGPAGPSLAALPARGIVAFYRAEIGPAIGSRCDLQPSCSQYFLEASRAHGLLGVPLMADRFVREPSVVAAKEKPVTLPDGRIRYADPVSGHDHWLPGGNP